MSLLVATWTGALATVGLLVGAAFTAWYARKAFREQSEEVKILQQQAKRDIDYRRRDQAAHVFAWAELRPYDDDPGDMRAAACLRNTSQQPVYNVRLGWGADGQQTWRVLLPGEERVIPGAGSAVADGTVPVWAEFRDAAGISWHTTSDGELGPV
jgi:hypothetical protein